jgi:hypothetical protein
MQVGDIVVAGNNTYRITGIYLGGVGTQNLVGLESLNKAHGWAHGSKVEEMLVPEELVVPGFLQGVYRRVD